MFCFRPHFFFFLFFPAGVRKKGGVTRVVGRLLRPCGGGKPVGGGGGGGVSHGRNTNEWRSEIGSGFSSVRVREKERKRANDDKKWQSGSSAAAVRGTGLPCHKSSRMLCARVCLHVPTYIHTYMYTSICVYLPPRVSFLVCTCNERIQ